MRYSCALWVLVGVVACGGDDDPMVARDAGNDAMGANDAAGDATAADDAGNDAMVDADAGRCPDGYVGGGTACAPTLTGLTLSSGTLSPALDDATTNYWASVALETQTITLTPTAPSAAIVTINDDTVASGSPWTTPVLSLAINTITIVVSETGRTSRSYTLTLTRGRHQEAYIKASNTGQRDDFGRAVALSADGTTLAVGASIETSNATGVDGDQANNSVPAAGAVYVFTQAGGVWSQQAYLKASNTGMGDYFGGAVTLSADGNTLAVGAHFEDSNATGVNGDQDDNSSAQSGAVYVFTRAGSTWSQQAYLKGSMTRAMNQFGNGNEFGSAVALSADGNTLAVGASGEASDATGINGDEANTNASFSGAVYVFTRTGTAWSQQAYIKASNTRGGHRFGSDVALAQDGNTLAVGAPDEHNNATGINGDQTGNSSSQSGAVYVFTRTGTAWSQQAYIKASNTGERDRFGAALALSAGGDSLAVGAAGESSNATGINGDQTDNSADESGAVYVFTRAGNLWSQQAYIKASNTDAQDNFGVAVSLSADGSTLAIGALESSQANGTNGDQTDNSADGSGAAYVFTRTANLWSQQAYIKASNPETDDFFGTDLALSADGTTLAVGARWEASNATGINGDQTNNNAAYSGAVYVFR